MTCAQSLTLDPLIKECTKLGIGHATIPPEDQYTPEFQFDLGPRPVEQARQLFAQLRPDVILFSDGSQLSHLAAKLAAAESAVPYIVIVHLPRLDAEPCGDYGGPPPWPELCRRSRAVRGGFSGEPGVARAGTKSPRRADASDCQRRSRILLRAAHSRRPPVRAPVPRCRRRTCPGVDDGGAWKCPRASSTRSRR